MTASSTLISLGSYEVDIREVKKIRKQDEMQKCYETSPVGKSKEAPLKGRKKG